MNSMKNTAETRIVSAIAAAEKASHRPNAYPFLPEIIGILRQMLNMRSSDFEQRSRMGGGLAKLVTEQYAFSESRLGTMLLNLADDYVSIQD